MENPELLLVIPAYKEGRRLPLFLPPLLEAISRAEAPIGVRVVDDGSGPIEQALLMQLAKECCAKHQALAPPLMFDCNQGKGAAIRAGWREDQGCPWLGFVDADGSVSPGEILRVFHSARVATDSDAFFSSRVTMLGRAIQRSPIRRLSGKLFMLAVGFLIHPGVYDSQCGFKIVRTQAYRRIESEIVENGYCFDLELLILLLREGSHVREIPIDWEDKEQSRVRIFRDGIRMLWGLIRLRKRHAIRASSFILKSP